MCSLGDYTLISRLKFINDFIKSSRSNKVPQILLILLLKGAFLIRKNSISRKISQNNDYTKLGICKNNNQEIKKFINDFTTKKDERNLHENYDLYKIILLEFLACFHSFECGQGIVSFVHTYRILERVSFAIPLLYAKKSNDYIGTYDYFKSFFMNSDSKVGELKFLKSTLDLILTDTEKEFPFIYELDSQEKKALAHLLSDIKNIKVINCAEGHIFEISIIDSINLLINVRNSFFHSLSGKRHINLEALQYPDKTLIKLFPNFINILSFITFTTLEYLYES